MRTLGFPHQFKALPWADVRDNIGPVAAEHPECGYLIDIIDSVLESGRENELAVTTSHNSLLITPAPPAPPPIELLRVNAPDERRNAQPGHVRIEHLSVTGRNDDIERPTSEAVALFWRFAIEKFGVHPDHE